MPTTWTIFDGTDNTFTTDCGKKFVGTTKKINLCLRLHRKKCEICRNETAKCLDFKHKRINKNCGNEKEASNATQMKLGELLFRK